MQGLGDRLKSASSQLSAATADLLPGWLIASGLGAWLVLGIAGVMWVAGWFFATSASISIPLLLAMVIGMVAYPLCERMTDRGLPKSGAAAIVLVMLLAIVAVVFIVTFRGIVSQLPAIQQQITRGIQALTAQLNSIGVSEAAVQSAISQSASPTSTATASAGPLASGLLSSLGSVVTQGISGIFNLAFGAFIALTLLFYVLSDFPSISGWLGAHMGGLPVDVGEGIVTDAVSAMRGYFRATTISGFAVASIITIAMFIMGVPLAIPVGLVTFLTCYIPFFGAIFSGAFAFLVALGNNGMPSAVALLVIVLVTQNVLQTVINAKVMGDSLNLHPLVVLVVTMLGGIFGGLLGAALGAPLAALLINAGKRLRVAFTPAKEPGPAESPA